MPRWTSEARLKQSEIQKIRQSWRFSTGPKTLDGKKISSRNALKHGAYSVRARRFKHLMRLQRQFLARAKAYERLARIKRRYVMDILSGLIPCPPHLAGALSSRAQLRGPPLRETVEMSRLRSAWRIV